MIKILLVLFGLNIFTPEYNNITLELQSSVPDDKDITFTCCGAFTKEMSLTSHEVVGNYFSNGNAHLENCNYDSFIFTNGKYYFVKGKSLRFQTMKYGMGFQQLLIIYDYKRTHKTITRSSKKLHYRALCEYNHKLSIIEAEKPMTFADYASRLLQLKVRYAMYLDTDYGWQDAWYRDAKGNKKWLHKSLIFPFRSNFITFRK